MDWRNWRRAAVAAALAAGAAGCGQDCREAARMGDFEFSQGNYPNAIKLYEKALRSDPNCGSVEEKLLEARRKAGSGG